MLNRRRQLAPDIVNGQAKGIDLVLGARREGSADPVS
jgi:hypothetical protein